MTNPFIEIQKWFDNHSKRDKYFLFGLGFLIIFLIYYLLFLNPIVKQKKMLSQNIESLKIQDEAIQQQIATIKATVNNPEVAKALEKKNNLLKKINDLDQQLTNLNPVLFSVNDLARFRENLLNQQRANVTLISLQEFPVEPWYAQENADKNTSKPDAYQHIIQIEFQNDYFNTIKYLKNLESISPFIYWDTIDYKVLQHPKAVVTLKFHVLSTQAN